MRLIVAIAGLSLIGFAAGWELFGLWAGVRIAVALTGLGMTIDAIRPNRTEQHKDTESP